MIKQPQNINLQHLTFSDNAKELYNIGYRLHKQRQDEIAFLYFQKSASLGLGAAQYVVGICHLHGIGTPIDLHQACEWLKIAMNAHIKKAFTIYAQILFRIRRYVDYKSSLITLKTGANTYESYICMKKLANIYRPHTLNQRDKNSKCIYWIKKLAKRGCCESQFALVRMVYRETENVSSSELMSFWLKRAAENGHSLAAYALGRIYEVNEDSPESISIAIHWYKKAQMRGCKSALHRLQTLCESKV